MMMMAASMVPLMWMLTHTGDMATALIMPTMRMMLAHNGNNDHTTQIAYDCERPVRAAMHRTVRVVARRWTPATSLD